MCDRAHSAPRLWLATTIAELRCAARTISLLAHGALSLPMEHVDRQVWFADGSRSRVYRETRNRVDRIAEPVTLVVRFRLKWLNGSRLAHALFRLESMANTLLFAGHEGFVTKLWMTDQTTWFYRGVYQWDGVEAARRYAETLRVVLSPWVEPSSFDYRSLPGVERDHFLNGRVIDTAGGGEWWMPMPFVGHAD